jgi:hypothetical protein
MSNPCDVVSCTRHARAQCYCCQKNICLFHLNEHSELLNNQLKPLNEHLDMLSNHLRAINIQETNTCARQTLERWRSNCHERIEQYYTQKCDELHRLVNEKIDEQHEDIKRLQDHVNELIRTQETNRDDIDYVTNMIDQITKTINTIEKTFVEIQTQPVTINKNSITIKGVNDFNYDLSILSSVYKIISVPRGSYCILTCNDRCLLIHQAPYLCLVDQDLNIVKQIQWRHGTIFDMCWSLTLKQFIIINGKDLFLLDQTTMTINQAKLTEKKHWFSCACSDEFLFLSSKNWSSLITKISLLSSSSLKQFGQQWESPVICEHDEYIDKITYQEKTLAMIIRNRAEKNLRIDLISSETLKPIWSIQLDISWNPDKPFHCCPFISGDWLVTDYDTGRLIHVTRQGKIQSIAPCNIMPFCSSLFGLNRLAVSAKDGIYFYHLNHRKKYTIFVV